MGVIYEIRNGKKRAYLQYVCPICTEEKLTRKETFKENLHCRKCLNILNKGNKAHNWKGYGSVSHSYFNALIHSAKARDLEFSITIEYLDELFEKQQRKCYYSDLPLAITTNKEKDNGNASIDRINSDVGYIKTNIVWCHKDINRMKSNLSKERFLELCKLIAEKEGTHWG